ncbi:MAG TPA: HRDC domain-containing protein [Anaerolineaceae bacterium]|nr:HRDC domain-containing protein [Anaerolineaceae bacterium]
MQYNDDMMMPEMPAPIVVEDEESFAHMCADLAAQPAIAVDTESNSLHAYQERVCLIQISTRAQDYLVDTLALDSLDLLGEVFANPAIQKVFHAGDYDLTCLKRDYAFTFANYFDTSIAAAAVGEENLGLSTLLTKYFGFSVDKRYQRANWGKRPLDPEMLRYAQSDSHFLLPLRDRLLPRLQASGRLRLVLEDCAALAQQTPPMKNHSEDVWRVKGINGMKPRALSLLQQLNHLREELARKQDVPLFKVMSDAALVELATTQPKHIQELDLLPSLSKSQVRRYGKQIMQTVADWHKSPGNLSRPRVQYLDESIQRRRELLGDWRKQMAQKEKVSSSVILPKDLLENIAAQPIKSKAELEQAMQASPTRFEVYGEELLEILRKENE